jgi:hypothetical protein
MNKLIGGSMNIGLKNLVHYLELGVTLHYWTLQHQIQIATGHQCRMKHSHVLGHSFYFFALNAQV